MHTGNVAAAVLSAGDPLLLLAGASTAAPLIASGSSSAGADAQQGTMTLVSAAVAQAKRGAETDIGFSVPAPYSNLAARQPATVDGQHVPAGSWTPVSAMTVHPVTTASISMRVASRRRPPPGMTRWPGSLRRVISFSSTVRCDMGVQHHVGTRRRLIWIITGLLLVSVASVLLTAAKRSEYLPKSVDRSRGPASSTPTVAPAVEPLVSVAELRRLPEVTTDTVIAAAPTDPHPFGGAASTVVHNRQPVALFTAPGATPFARLPVTQLGNDTWLPVIGERSGWFRVLLPSRPNGSTGWLQASDVTCAFSRFKIHVDVAAARLRLLRDGQQTGTWRVSTGTAHTPTPGGRTFLLAAFTDLAQPFSPVILALGVRSNALDTYAGGPGTVGIHPWPGAGFSARPASHGCIRIPRDALHVLTSIPIGSLVRIYQL